MALLDPSVRILPGLWFCLRLPPRDLLLALLVFTIGEFISAPVLNAEEPGVSEYAVKAAFLASFPKYVDWPTEAFVDTKSPIVIGVMGETRVTRELQRVVAGRVINGRALVVKGLDAGDEAAVCHILFIPAEEQQRSINVLAKRKRGLLTVGESDDFLEKGGMISLPRRNQKIALDVNLTAASNAGMKLSSKLLGVASTVKGKPN